MQNIKAVLAGVLVMCSAGAAAAGQADLSLWGAAPRRVSEIGESVSIGVAVTNAGPDAAEGVLLSVNATDLRLARGTDFRCSVIRGATTCRVATLASGEQISFTFTGIVRSSKAHLNVLVDSSSHDPNSADNTIQIDPQVGYLGVDPGQLAARLPFDGGPDHQAERTISAGVSLVNDTSLAMSYQAAFVPVLGAGIKPGAPWATVTPDSGSVLEFSSEPLKIMMSVDFRAPGLHRGVLRFEHDSPFTLRDLPVSFTVAYWDVPADDAVDPYVHALAGARVATGCDTGRFCPATPLTRATAAVWLLRSKEGAAYMPEPAEGKFDDVPVESPEAPFIEELVRRGVSAGCGGESFCPEQPVSRADFAVLVLQMQEGPTYAPPTARGRFRDMRRANPRAAWLEEAARRSLISACTGPTGTQVCPAQEVSRGEAATVLVKAFAIPTF
jgi:hypothetical protein